MAKVAGKQSRLNRAAAGKHSRQMICPAQASKQHNSQQTLAGLAANNNRRRRWPASRRAVQVDGGSAVVLALKRRAQTYLTCLSPSHRSPLPVTVHTHSHNLEKTQFSPNLLFVFIIFIPLLPHYKFVP